jgi:hypothetical protein
MRIKKAVGVGVLVGGIGIAAAACAPTNVHWETYPTGTSTSLQRAEQHWWVDGGGNSVLAVARDMTALNNADSSESQSQGLAAMNALEHDASAAARNPWPGDPTDYVNMMSGLATGIKDLQAGDDLGASNAFNSSDTAQDAGGWGTDFPALPSGLEG